MRIVADTNILIASIFWSGAPYKIVQSALNGEIKIFTCEEILREARKVLKDPKEKFRLSEQETERAIIGIKKFADVAQLSPTFPRVIMRDSSDDAILNCAVTSGSSFIVTRDKDILTIREYQGIKILTPEDFIKQKES